jgi:hypothetical protein
MTTIQNIYFLFHVNLNFQNRQISTVFEKKKISNELLLLILLISY